MTDAENPTPFPGSQDLPTCRVRGRPGRFYLLKLCPRKARVLPVDQPHTRGLLVSKADLRDVRQPGLFPGWPDQRAESDDESPGAGVSPEIPPLPLGLHELEDTIVSDPGPPPLVKCYVRGCEEMLRPPSRGFRGDCCKAHGIYCHLSGSSVTLTYRDFRRNLIVSPELFARKVRGNPHKVESHRFGFLNSEDAVSWNVLRSLQEAQALHLIAQWVTGQEITTEPFLYLWGLSSSDNRFEPWPLLTEARRRFEIGRLPVARPLSEPDIALVIPGRLVLLIEAKLLSANPVVYRGQPRRTPQSLTMDELLDLYHDPALRILDFDRLHAAERICSQLHRYLVFAEFLARADGPSTQAYLANLVRAGQEHESTSEFRQFLRPEYADRFTRMTWETVYALAGLHWRRLAHLQEYMLAKPVGVGGRFVPAFQLDAW
jgi:hypothetical protein